MANAKLIERNDGPTVEFIFTAPKQDYVSIASFLNDITAQRLVNLGFTVPHAKAMLTSTVYKLFFAFEQAETESTRLVLPLSALTDLTDIIARSENKSPALVEFKNILSKLKQAA